MQHLLQANVRTSLESTESRAEQMLRISQDALSHLQFQDPVAQSLWQVQLGLSALANMVGANLPEYENVDRHHVGTSGGHNPLHALASQYGLKLVHGASGQITTAADNVDDDVWGTHLLENANIMNACRRTSMRKDNRTNKRTKERMSKQNK